MGRVPDGGRPLQDVEEESMREFAKEMLVMILATAGISIGLSIAIGLVTQVMRMIVNG